MTGNGAEVTQVAARTVITLTASVISGRSPLTTGRVNFCDAAAKYCTDIHLLGMAQLTSSGTAVLRLRPGIGTHSYRAVFLGTRSDAGSASDASSLKVTGTFATSTSISALGGIGDYSLTATVTAVVNAPNVPGPSGTVSFVDTTTANSVLTSGALGASTAGLSFLNASDPATVSEPNVVAAADFNGDGIEDLAVSNSNSGETALTILLGRGDGTFTATATSPTVGLYPDSIVVADFNGDGIPDLALTSVDQNIVTILLGKGDGNFSENAPNLNTVTTPQSVATGDFNGDGIADLAVANGSGVLVFLGKGDGTFTQTATSLQTGRSPIAVAVEDFNGDGNADLAVVNNLDSTITILLGNGDGTFTAEASPVTGGNPVGIVVGDLNGDGVPDLAVADYDGNIDGDAVDVFLGNGDGTFKPAAKNNEPGLSFRAPVVADFNGDGIADLAVGDFWNEPIILLGNGDGTFAPGLFVSANISLGSGYLAAADFDGDGISDLVEPNQGVTGTAVVLLAQPTQAATAT